MDTDVPEEDVGWGYSFVTSDTDPRTGYFLPSYEKYIYRVTCTSSSSCQFVKINTGYKNPASPVTKALPPDSSLTCN